MDREDNEKGRIIYKIVDGLVLGYLNRRKYKKAELGIVSDSLWLRRKNPEMPVMFTPTLHEKSLEDIIELFFHYGRFDIPSDFLYMEQQLRQISNQFTESLVNFSQTNRKKMEDRHHRYLLQQRNHPNELMSGISERNARLGQPVSAVPPLLQVRTSQFPQQSHPGKRKAQDEFVYPSPRAEFTQSGRLPPSQRIDNGFSEEPSGLMEVSDSPQKDMEDHNLSFEPVASRRKSKPHHVKNDINTLVTLAASKAQQRLNKEVEDDNWDLGDQFAQWVGQLPPIEEFCVEQLWEAAEQMETPTLEPSSSSQAIRDEPNSQEILGKSARACHPMESQERPASVRPMTLPMKKMPNSFVSSDICESPKDTSVRSSQKDLSSPTFSPDNASMEDLFGREDGEISESPKKLAERLEETTFKPLRREEEAPRRPKSQEPRKRTDSFKIKTKSLHHQQQRAPSTSSTSSSITSRIDETPPRVEKEWPKGEAGREKRREHDKELGRQKERERIEKEKQRERQKEREKLEKAREARRAKEEKEKQAKERERKERMEKERDQRREVGRDPQRKVDSYAGSSTAQRRDSRTQSSSSSTASENEQERERDRGRRSPRSPAKEKVRERAESSTSKWNTQNIERREKEKEHNEERRRADSNSQIRKKEVEKAPRPVEPVSKTNEKGGDPAKSKKPRANLPKPADNPLDLIETKADASRVPRTSSPHPVQASSTAVRSRPVDILSQIFPDAPKFSPTTIKIPKMRLPVQSAEPHPAAIASIVEERENTPEKPSQMSIGFPDQESKNLITKSSMSDSRLACLLANVSKKREKMREEGVDLDAFDPERNDEGVKRRNSVEESPAPIETSDILENDQPPVKIRRKIDLEMAENVLSQIHGV